MDYMRNFTLLHLVQMPGTCKVPDFLWGNLFYYLYVSAKFFGNSIISKVLCCLTKKIWKHLSYKLKQTNYTLNKIAWYYLLFLINFLTTSSFYKYCEFILNISSTNFKYKSNNECWTESWLFFVNLIEIQCENIRFIGQYNLSNILKCVYLVLSITCIYNQYNYNPQQN